MPATVRKIMILGGGPNRIGQGIEFDYCCVHAVFALKEDGFQTIMVNCNPETVSTDYDNRRPAVLRAAHLRRRDEHRRRGAARRRDRPVRRPDAPQPGGAAGARRGAHPRHLVGQHRPRRGPPAFPAADHPARPAPAGQRHGDLAGTRRGASPSVSATRWWCGRPTCWADAPMEIVYDDPQPGGVHAAGGSGCRRTTRCSGGQVSGGRRRGWTWTPFATATTSSSAA